MRSPFIAVVACWASIALLADDGFDALSWRHQLEPGPDQTVEFLIDGVAFTCWRGGGQSPRPYFFPVNGPSGAPLTRMGHPGAPNHAHHRSLWFASHDVDGIDFWSDTTDARIRQSTWLAYNDGPSEGAFAMRLLWEDAHGMVRMEQDTVAAFRGRGSGDRELELQITLRPGAGRDQVVLGKTNFGLLAVRVARSISAHFGGGVLTDSEGRVGESEIFGKRAQWMDYSGPVAVGVGARREARVEGITLFDHPSNPRFPTRWHVRDDGWMGSSFCYDAPWTVTQERPLRLRYLVLVHSGGASVPRNAEVAESFASRPAWLVEPSSRPHRQFDLRRVDAND